MRAYLSVFRMKFICDLQYRAAAIAGLSTQFFFGFVFIMVYLAFYESGSGNVPMPLDQLVTYLWLNQAFFSLISMWYKDKEIILMIKKGDVAYELCRPQNLYFKWFAKIYATKITSVLLRFFPVIIIALLLPAPFNLSLPHSFPSFVAFLTTLFMSSLLVAAIITLFHIITFFTMEIDGITNMFRVISEVFAGQIVPIPFLPPFLLLLANILPFRYVGDLPFRLYSGNIPVTETIPNIIIQTVWIFLLVILGYSLSKIALKRVVVQGG